MYLKVLKMDNQARKLLTSCPFHHRKDDDSFSSKFNYDNDFLLLGKDEDKDDSFIDVSESFRACTIAKTRTGKTMKIRRGLDEAFWSGFSIAVLPDAKDEYKSSLHPIQKKFRRNLPKGEKPKGLPMRVFRPTFFKKAGPLPKNNEWCSIDFSFIKKPDFMTLCNYDGFKSDKMQREFDELWINIERNGMTDLDEIEELCVEELGFGVLWRKISFIKTCGLFDSRFIIDPVDILKNREVLVLNYNDFDKLDMKNNSLDQVFLGIWLRLLIQAKKDNEINNLIIFNDETGRWVPRNGSPACKTLIMHSIDEHAGFGVSYWFAFQREKSVPEDLIRQCKYVFIPYNADRALLEFILKNQNILTRGIFHESKLFKEILETLKAKKYRWLKISEGDYEFLDPYSPISAHMESRKIFPSRNREEIFI